MFVIFSESLILFEMLPTLILLKNELYEISNSNIKKNKKVIKVHKLARKEFKEIFNIYLDELKLDENTTNNFLKL